MSKKHKTRGNGDRSFQSSGKGDKNRTTNVDAFRRNFDEVNWERAPRAADFERGEKIKANFIARFLRDMRLRGP